MPWAHTLMLLPKPKMLAETRRSGKILSVFLGFNHFIQFRKVCLPSEFGQSDVSGVTNAGPGQKQQDRGRTNWVCYLMSTQPSDLIQYLTSFFALDYTTLSVVLQQHNCQPICCFHWVCHHRGCGVAWAAGCHHNHGNVVATNVFWCSGMCDRNIHMDGDEWVL